MVCIFNVVYFLLSILVVGKKRSVFKSVNLQEMHVDKEGKAITETNTGGFPDCGEGRYSDKLSYKDWYEFMCRQRAFGNLNEQYPVIIGLTVIGGLFIPITAAVICFVQIVFRLAYTVGYAKNGPGGRLIGTLVANLTLWGYGIAALVMSIILVLQ